MKKPLFSTIAFLICSVALTACSSGASGTSSGDGGKKNNTSFATGETVTINALGSINSKNPQDTNIGDHTSLSAIKDDNVTLQGLAVFLNDTATYKRETTDTEWVDTDNLNIKRQITPTRLASPAVTLKFDANGNISGVTATYITEYTATADTGTTLSGTSFTGTYTDDDRIITALLIEAQSSALIPIIWRISA